MEHSSLHFSSADLTACSQSAVATQHASAFPTETIGESTTVPQTSAAPSKASHLVPAETERRKESSSNCSTARLTSPSPSSTRRVAFVERTTEELGRHSPLGLTDSSTLRSDSLMDSQDEAESLVVRNGVHEGFLDSGHFSLLSLSLQSGERRDLRGGVHFGRSEILSRRSDMNSCLASTPSTVIYADAMPPLASEGAVKLSKSAKKRRKKKEKRQAEQTQPDKSTGQAVGDAGCRSQEERVVQSVRGLIGESVPDTGVRFCEQGMQNLGNTCFLSSAMQFLLASPQFCWLMIEMKAAQAFVNRAAFPVIYSLGSLASVLTLQPTQLSQSRDVHLHPTFCPNLSCSVQSMASSGWIKRNAISPEMLSSVVSMFQSRVKEQRGVDGQDVHEFMLFVLNQIEREIVQLRHMSGHQDYRDALAEESESDAREEGWMVVGKKNKVSVQRMTGSAETSILSSIFGGCVQSEVKAAGMTPSVTMHLYTTLMLDIAPPAVQTIEDALTLYTAQDTIPDYRMPNSSRKVIAAKSSLFRQLPPFLIICLKQYTYTESGLAKLHKSIGFGAQLEFRRKWLAESFRKTVTYRLVATCNHHGQGRGGDHYTANVLQRDGTWTHFNDSSYQSTQVPSVLSDTPYLLMYERL